MNVKKIAIFGLIAAVVLGCVLAAGCTSTTNPIVGTWGKINYDDQVSLEATTFFADGTGKEDVVFINGDTETYTFTWKQASDKNAYLLNYSDGEIWAASIADDEEPLKWKQLNSAGSNILVDHGTTTLDVNGKKVTYDFTLKSDYTGTLKITTEDNKVTTQSFTWNQNTSDVFTITTEDNSRWRVIFDSEKAEPRFIKVDYSDDPIIGVHSSTFILNGQSISYSINFKENGTGTDKMTFPQGKTMESPIVWEPSIVLNKYDVVMPMGTICFVFDVSLDKDTKKLSIENVTPIVVDNYRENNKHVFEIHIINGDKLLDYYYDADGNPEIYPATWTLNGDLTVNVTYSDGESYTLKFNPETKTVDWT